MQQNRSSNIELFRILLMLSIVAHHYVVNSGVFDVVSQTPYDWHDYFLLLFGMWGKIGINCFVLITGYFMCKSEITIRKFLQLFLEVLFYKIVCYVCFYISGYEVFSIRGLLHSLNPISSLTHGFVSCFLVYYLLIPFVNILVQNLTKKQHQLLIIICMLFTVILPHCNRYVIEFNYVEWFVIIHVIASYIRFYHDVSNPLANTQGVLYIIGGILLRILSVVIMMVGYENGIAKMRWMYEWVIDSNALLAVVVSLMLFYGFKNLHIKQSKVINYIASSTFAVLLIHANSDAMRQWLWRDVCQNVEMINSPWMPIHAVCCVLGVFVVCVIIDKVRIFLIEKPLFVKIDKILAKYGIR